MCYCVKESDTGSTIEIDFSEAPLGIMFQVVYG
jgi:hypothetical protein